MGGKQIDRKSDIFWNTFQTLNESNTMLPAIERSISLPDMSFLIRLLGGGLPSGKLIGMVGPSGGGKTCLAMQITIAMACAGNRVLYIGLDPNDRLPERLNRLINRTSTAAPDEKELAQRSELRTQISSLIQTVDSDSITASDSLDSLLADSDTPFDLIVIDQLALWTAAHGQTPDQQTIQHVCTGLKQTAQTSNIPVLLLHQMEGALKSSPATRLPESTDAMNSRSFGTEDIDLGLFLGCLDDQNLCWLSSPATNRHKLVWLDGDHARFRSVGDVGRYYQADRISKGFSLTPEARKRGLFTPADVAYYLEDGSVPAGEVDLTKGFLYVCQEFLPEITALYAAEYTAFRNEVSPKPPYQQSYTLNKRLYGPAFWKEVFLQHFTYGCSFETTLSFLRSQAGRSYCPWPDLLRRLPQMIRENPELEANHYAHLNQNPVRSPLGAFRTCASDQDIEDRYNEVAEDKHQDAASKIWAFMMCPESWDDLTGPSGNRKAVARLLDRMLEEGRLNELERILGSQVKGFFDHFNPASPRDPQNETPIEDPHTSDSHTNQDDGQPATGNSPSSSGRPL